MDFILSAHTREMLSERRISEEWVGRTINSPDRSETRADGNVHFFKGISENEGRVLHVVLNPRVSPRKVVTAFLDRQGQEATMKLKVDKENDALYFRLGETSIVESEEVQPGIILDFSADGKVVGVEILNLSARMSPEQMKIFQFETA